MNLKQTIDSKASQGTRLILQGQSREACDILLEAWELVKQLMQDEGHANLDALDRAYPQSEPVFNWAQDLEQELYNAGLDDSAYLAKRIAYGYELIDRCQGMNMLIIENARQAIAETHYMLGDQETCDRLFQGWLDEDPAWGWGIIHWADCYHLGLGKGAPDHARAEAIIRQGLEHQNVRDRADVLERAIEIYQALGDSGKTAELKAESRRLAGAARVTHVGRNDPCPCGSGKKYKKCCGK
ncbi:MAG: SEC-C metal-binding domain-containing protein [Eubacteriales bacterium]|jgi:preprotein translocase subunit SecA|nr:SEC-C metal-binding domain-containing protein [Eubacteriales bacterium]